MKTRIHKFTVFVIGFNDHSESPVALVEEEIKNTKTDLCMTTYHEKSIVVDDYGDDHILNQSDTTRETWESFMDDELIEAFEKYDDARQKLEKRKKELGL